MLRVNAVHRQDNDAFRRSSDHERGDAASAALLQDALPDLQHHVHRRSARLGGAVGGGEETATSTLPVMGCESKVVLAIAETSTFAH